MYKHIFSASFDVS